MKLKPITLTFAIFAAALTQASMTPNPSPLNKVDAVQSKPMASPQSMEMTSGKFKGVEVNGGTASIYQKDGRYRLRVSSDFMVPNSPAPHFQVVDMEGNIYLLGRLTLVGDKTQRDIVLPKYIKNVAKVQIWCSFAEVNLGEATFAKAVKTH